MNTLVELILSLILPFFVIPALIVFVRGVQSLLRSCCSTPRQGPEWWRDNFSSDAVRTKFINSKYGRRWILVDCFISIFAIFNFVLLTYETVPAPEKITLDIIYLVFFAVDYMIFFYAAEDRLSFFFNRYSIIDLITIVPSVILIVCYQSPLFEDNLFIYIARLCPALRILRVYRLLSFAESEEQRTLYSALLSIGVLLFMGASVINILENQSLPETKPDLSRWHDALYYTVVTFSTIGFGDLVPTNTYSRVAVMVMILGLIFLIPYNSARIAHVYRSRSPFSAARSNHKSHIVVCCDATSEIVVELSREYFANYPDSHVVFLSPKDPSSSVKRLLRKPGYKDRVTYLSGNPSVASDLARANLRSALAVFVFSSDQQYDDRNMLLYILSIKHYFGSIPLFAVVENLENKDICIRAGANMVFCKNEIRMSLLASSIYSVGILSFLANILNTYPAPKISEQSVDNVEDSWLAEYVWGSSQSIFAFPVPQSFVGSSFKQLCVAFFFHHKIVAFAIRKQPLTDEKSIITSDPTYSLNAADLVLCVAMFEPKAVFETPAPSKSMLLKSGMELAQNENDKPLEFSGHVIVCGDVDHSCLCLLLENIKLKSTSVVFLRERPLPEVFEWDQFPSQHSIQIIVGRINVDAFVKAGILKSKCVLLLSSPHQSSTRQDADVAYFKTIINQYFPSVPCILEVVDTMIPRLLCKGGNHVEDDKMITNVMGNYSLRIGERMNMYAALRENWSLFDFAPKVMEEEDSLSWVTRLHQHTDLIPYPHHHFSQEFAAGNIFNLTSVLIALSIQSFFKPYIREAISFLVERLEIRQVPEYVAGRTIADLYLTCIQQGRICVGLVRSRKQGKEAYFLCEKEKYKYIFTNPPSHCIVRRNDFFVSC